MELIHLARPMRWEQVSCGSGTTYNARAHQRPDFSGLFRGTVSGLQMKESKKTRGCCLKESQGGWQVLLWDRSTRTKQLETTVICELAVAVVSRAQAGSAGSGSHGLQRPARPCAPWNLKSPSRLTWVLAEFSSLWFQD